MKLKFEKREYVTESFSCLFRVTMDSVTRKATGKVYGINTSKDGEVLTVHIVPYKYQWNNDTPLDFIARSYEGRFFKCDKRFTPIKGLNRCANKTFTK